MTHSASRVLVNSAYTASVYAESFRLLRTCKALIGEPRVLHPAIDLQRNQPRSLPCSMRSRPRR